MIRKFFLGLLIVLSFTKLLYADQVEDLLRTAGNILESEENRRKAVEEIKIHQDSRILPAFIKIIRNGAESIVFRSYVVDQLTQSNDEWTMIELKKIVSETSLPSEIRKPILYSLWMKNPAEFKPVVMNITQNPAEPVDLRVTALTYLRTSDLKLPISFWKRLISKNNDTQIRIAALNGMEQQGFLIQEKISLVQIIHDPNEEIPLRKTAVLNAERALPPEEVTPELIRMISAANNSLEIRKFALDHLASYPVTNSIPQLEKILALEKNPAFKNELKIFLESAQQK